MKIVVEYEDTKFLINTPQDENIQWLVNEVGKRIRKRQLLSQGMQNSTDATVDPVPGELFTKDSLLLDSNDLIKDTFNEGDEVVFKPLILVEVPQLSNIDAKVNVHWKLKSSVFRIPQRHAYTFGDLAADAARHFHLDPDSVEMHSKGDGDTVVFSSRSFVLDEIVAFNEKKSNESMLQLILVGHKTTVERDESDPLAVRQNGRTSPSGETFHPRRSEIARDLILDHRPEFLKEQEKEKQKAEEREQKIKEKTEKLMLDHVPPSSVRQGRSTTHSFNDVIPKTRDRSRSIEIARPLTRQRRGSVVMSTSPIEGSPDSKEDMKEDIVKSAVSSVLSGTGVVPERDEFKLAHEHADVWADEKAEWVSRSGFVGPVLATHIPLYVALSTLDYSPRESEFGPGPGKYQMTGVICHFRISGFLELVNAALVDCDSGAKHDDAAFMLTRTSDELFGRIVDIIRANRGDIMNITPEGVTAFWQPSAKGVESAISNGGRLVLQPPPLAAEILDKADKIVKEKFSFRKSRSRDPSSSPPNSPLKPPIIVTTVIGDNNQLKVGKEKKIHASKSAHEQGSAEVLKTPQTRARRMSQTSEMGAAMKGRLKELQHAEPSLGGVRGGRGRTASLALMRPRAASMDRKRSVDSSAVSESELHVPSLSSNKSVLAAAQCALEVVSSISCHEYGSKKSVTKNIFIRAGIAVGDIRIWRVGGTGASWHNTTIGGTAIEDAKELTFVSASPGMPDLDWNSVIVTPGAWCSMSDVCEGIILSSEEGKSVPATPQRAITSPSPGDSCVLLKKVIEPLVVTPDQMCDAASLFSKQTSGDAVLNAHWFLPRKVLGHIFAACGDAALIEGERPSNGTGLGIEPDLDSVGDQAVVVIRMEMPSKLLSAKKSTATSPSELSLGHSIVHQTVSLVQQACIRRGGVIVQVNKEIAAKNVPLGEFCSPEEQVSSVFEFIGIFGMPPFMTEADMLARQALLAGLGSHRCCHSVIQKQKQVCKIEENQELLDEIKISVGVADGCGFCASVGSRTSRREYIVVGPAVQNAAELCKDDRGLVLCSEGVKKRASQWIDFLELDNSVFVVLRESGDPPHPISEQVWHHTGVLGHPRIRAEVWHRVRAFAREPSPFSGAVLIEGPGGSGKSALISEVLSAVALEKINAGGDDSGGSVNPYGETIKGEKNWPVLRVLRCTGEPSTRHTPYYAIRMLLGQLFCLDHLTPFADGRTAERSDEQIAKILSTAKTNILSCVRAGTSDDGLISMVPLIDAMLPPGLQVFTKDMRENGKSKPLDPNAAEGFCPDIPPHVRAGIRLDLVFALLRGSASATLSKGNRIPPLLICVEELQYIDGASLRIFTELCADMNPPPLLLVMTATPDLIQPETPSDARNQSVNTADGIELSSLARFVPQWEFGVGGREHGKNWREVAMSVIREGPYSLALNMASLLEEETNALICRTVHADTMDPGLAKIIHATSKGNATNAIQMAHALCVGRKCIVRSNSAVNEVKTVEEAKEELMLPATVFEGTPAMQRVPPTLESTLKDRISELNPVGLQVLAAAAAIGFSFRLSAVTSLLAATGGIPGIKAGADGSSTMVMLRVRKELKELALKGFIEVPRRTRRRSLLMAFSEKRVVGPGAVFSKGSTTNLPLPGTVLDEADSSSKPLMGLEEAEESMAEFDLGENELGEVFNFPSEYMHYTLESKCLRKEIKPRWFKAAAEWLLQVGIARISLMPVQSIGGDIAAVSRTSTRMVSMRRSLTSALVGRALGKRRSTVDSQSSFTTQSGMTPEERLNRESTLIEGLAPFLAGMVRQWFRFLVIPAQKEKLAQQSTVQGSGPTRPSEVTRIYTKDDEDYTNYEHYSLALNLCSVAGERARALHCPSEALSFFLAGRRIALRGLQLVRSNESGDNIYGNDPISGRGLGSLGAGMGSGPGISDSYVNSKVLMRLRAARFTRWAGDACVELARHSRQSQIKMETSLEEDARHWYVEALNLIGKPLPNSKIARSFAYWWFKIGQFGIRTLPRCCSSLPASEHEISPNKFTSSALLPNPISPGTAIVSVPSFQETTSADVVAHEELQSLLGIFEMYSRRCEITSSMRYVAVRAFVLAEPRWRAERSHAMSTFVRTCCDMLSLATDSGSHRAMHAYEVLLERAIGDTWTFCLHGPDSHSCFGEILGGVSNAVRCLALKELGRASATQADWAKSINRFSSACLFYEHIYDREGLGETSYLLGHVLYAVGDFEAARIRFVQSAESAAMVDNEIAQVRALAMKSICDVQLDSLGNAADSLSDAKEIASSWKTEQDSIGEERKNEEEETVDERLIRRGRDQALLELSIALSLAHSQAGDRSEAFEYVMEPADVLAASRPTGYDSFALYVSSFDVIHDLLEGEHLISYSQAGEYVSERMAKLMSISGRLLAAFEKFVSVFKFAKLRLVLWTSLLRSITISTSAGEQALAEAVRLVQKSEQVKMPFEVALLNYHVGRNAVGDARDSHLLKAMATFKELGASHCVALTERQLSLSKNMMDAM